MFLFPLRKGLKPLGPVNPEKPPPKGPVAAPRPHYRRADRHRSRRGRAPDRRELPHPPLLTGSQPALSAALFVFGLVEDALCIARGRFGLRFLAVLPVDAGEFQLDIGSARGVAARAVLPDSQSP